MRFNLADAKLPVPPVIIKVLFVNKDIFILLLMYKIVHKFIFYFYYFQIKLSKYKRINKNKSYSYKYKEYNSFYYPYKKSTCRNWTYPVKYCNY